MERIKELEMEIERLKKELETAKAHERELEDTRKAMLFVLEDLNETYESVSRAKKEWEQTFDALADLITIHDTDYRIIRANSAVYRKFGKGPEEIIGRKCYEIFHGTKEPYCNCPHRRTMEEHLPATEEIDDKHLGGIFLVSTYPIFDKNGKFCASVHIARDITKAKEDERRLLEESEISRSLLEISDAAARTTDITMFMENVVSTMVDIMGCQTVLSYLWDCDAGRFRPMSASGLDRELVPLFRTEYLGIDLPAVRKALEHCNDIDSEPFYFGHEGIEGSFLSRIKGIHTMFQVPLRGRKGCLGLLIGLCAGDFPACATGERYRRILKGVSNIVSTALEEAINYKNSVDRAMELSRRIETIQVMHEIDKTVLSSLDSREVLDTAMNMIAKIVPCDRATVALIDEENDVFRYEAGFGISFVSRGDTVSTSETSAIDVIRTMRPEYIADMREGSELLRPLEKRLLDEGFLSHIRVPLVVKGRVVGVLNVGAKRPAAFAPEDLATLEKLASQIGVAFENARLVDDLEDLFLGTVKALSEAIDAKSPWTKGHSDRVTEIALVIGRHMGLGEEELKDLKIAGLLHDIGKLGTYESILNKPERLTTEELDLIRQHPIKGADILSPIRHLRGIIPAIRHHHERYDGTGYPSRLARDEIPLMARILAVADTVDAMSADRPYRKGKPLDEILKEVKRCSGTQFDPSVVRAFVEVTDKHGIKSLAVA